MLWRLNIVFNRFVTESATKEYISKGSAICDIQTTTGDSETPCSEFAWNGNFEQTFDIAAALLKKKMKIL